MLSLVLLLFRIVTVGLGLWLAPPTQHVDPTQVAPTAVDVLPAVDEVKSHLPEAAQKPQIAAWLSEADPEILFIAVRLDKPRRMRGSIGMDDIALRQVGEKSDLLFATSARQGAWNQATAGISVMYINDFGKRIPIGPMDLVGNPQPLVWRGKDAPAAPDSVKELKGILRDYDVPSLSLGEARRVTVYLPPGYEVGKNPKPAVIYFADGGLIESMVGVVERLIVSNRIRPVVLVGAHTSDQIVKPKDLPESKASRHADPYASDARAMEYLEPLPDETESNAESAAIHRFMFDRHFKFFADDLPKWAEETLGVDSARESRIISGFSNSGGFVVTLSRRRPMEYGAVIANSIAGNSPPAETVAAFEGLPEKAKPPTFYFSGGTWEGYFASNTTAWDRYFRKHGAESHRLKVVGGHEQAIWELGIAAALPKLLPPRD